MFLASTNRFFSDSICFSAREDIFLASYKTVFKQLFFTCITRNKKQANEYWKYLCLNLQVQTLIMLDR